MNDQNQNPFDKRTLVAVVLMALLFMGWQKYLSQKYPDYYKPAATAVTGDGSLAVAAGTLAVNPSESTAVQGAPAATAVSAKGAAEPQNLVPYQDERIEFKISSLGMSLREVALRDYRNSEGEPKRVLEGASGFFELRDSATGMPIPFAIKETVPGTFEGRASLNGATILRTLKIDPSSGRMDQKVRIENAPADFPGFSIVISKQKSKGAGGNFLMPSLDHQEVIYKKEGTINRIYVYEDQETPVESSTSPLAAIGSQYFVAGMVDQSAVIPTIQGSIPQTGDLVLHLLYKQTPVQPVMEYAWVGYVGGKSLANLEKIDPELTQVVNFGFFATIGKWLLGILIWAHGLVGNWGWAIVVLTVLVRLVVLPFNVFAYKSMKKMQEIQPLLQSLRERYKDDPNTLNRETMAIMRDHKVNPLGGCLPMLLQMPVFFALYQVLGQSIELYQAPWILWIGDLSQKDPYFVLPVLMGVTMFIQQKLTPTTMDPMQAKILLWMPVIFSAFTLALPSGLTLYIFVSTLFGVIQQKIFMRDTKKNQTAVIEAKAGGRL